MRQNVLAFIRLISEVHQAGPIVEFGAAQIQDNANLRCLFPELDYVGCDLNLRAGVDVITDCTKSGLADGSAGTVIACDTIEHTARCWLFPEEAKRILRADGLMVVASPFYFPIHHNPDYWRLTPQCLDLLLSEFTYRTVYYQGDMALPHTVFGIATESMAVFERLTEHLAGNLQRVPGMESNEAMYAWRGERDYIVQRSVRGAAEVELTNRFYL